MGTVSGMNPGLASLLQTLSTVNSPVLSSSNVTAALEKAPPSDIVNLSAQAMQLQQVSEMFGEMDSSESSSGGGYVNSLLASLQASLTAQPQASPTTVVDTSTLQTNQVNALFGVQS